MGNKLLNIEVTKQLIDVLKSSPQKRMFYEVIRGVHYKKAVHPDVWELFDDSKCDNQIGYGFNMEVDEAEFNENAPLFQEFPGVSLIDMQRVWKKKYRLP